MIRRPQRSGRRRFSCDEVRSEVGEVCVLGGAEGEKGSQAGGRAAESCLRGVRKKHLTKVKVVSPVRFGSLSASGRAIGIFSRFRFSTLALLGGDKSLVHRFGWRRHACDNALLGSDRRVDHWGRVMSVHFCITSTLKQSFQVLGILVGCRVTQYANSTRILVSIPTATAAMTSAIGITHFLATPLFPRKL